MTQKIIPDHLQRERALDPKQSFIIQAPAGSGKTELLIQRLLVLLAQVNEPEEVLAITFTRKAAAEMATRVIEALQFAQTKPEPEADPARKTWRLAKKVLQRDLNHGWQIITNPHRLRIQTIDALCSGLTRQMPILSRFGAQPTITEDPYRIYQEAVRSFMATLDSDEPWAQAIADILLHLDNQHSKLEELLIGMLAKRDQWLPYLNAIHDNDELRSQLEAVLRQIAQEKLEILKTRLSPADSQELYELVLHACQQLVLQNDSRATIMCCKNLQQLPEFTAHQLKQWQAIAGFLLTQKLEWRKTVTVKDGFPTSSKNKAESEALRAMKARFLRLVESFSKDCELLQSLQEITLLPPTTYNSTQWQIVRSLVSILRILAGFLWLSFQEHNSVDHIEIAQRALQALGDSLEPSQLALRLDYQISHILVDEFQDTSSTQFRLLEKLTAGWQEEDGRSLFIVGDPMQSIYRFRKAEVGLFIQAETHGINEIKLTKLTLKTNFRSQAGLVNWFNQTFSSIFPATANMTKGAIPYSLAAGILPELPTAPVKIHSFLQDPSAETAEIVKLVQHYLATSQASIAILVRARNQLNDIIPALQEAGIGYRALEIETLAHKAIIQDLLALTRGLLFLDDRIAWLALLRAPWCGLVHEDLYTIAGLEPQLPIWERLTHHLDLPLTPDGSKRVERLVNILTAYIENRARKPLAYWLESAWLQLGGPASLKSAGELEDAQTFFKLLGDLQQGEDIANINLLELKLSELYASTTNHQEARVELMTIHKSKGLEFDVVILPSMQKAGTHDNAQLLLFAERPESSGLGLILAPIKAFAEQHDPIYGFIQREENQKVAYELSRLLYVAVTRAKHYLHLCGQYGLESQQQELKAPPKDSLLGKLWPQIAETVNQQLLGQLPHEPIQSPKMACVTHLSRFASDWQSPFAIQVISTVSQSQLSSEIELTTRPMTQKHIGTLLHRILCQLSQVNADRWPSFLDQEAYWRIGLQNLGMIPSELDYALDQIRDTLTKMLADPRGRWILTNTHDEAHSEFPLTHYNGENIEQVCIDRTFIDENGIRWIIDYKTSFLEKASLAQEQQKYRQQLETYASIMQPLEKRPIRLGLYFSQGPLWYEWDYSA